MEFGIVPAREWKLKEAVGACRRTRLLETPFDSIVQQIADEAVLTEYRWCEIEKLRNAKRIWIRLALPPQTVDLFHNGAGGYRAQFYLSVEQGEAANACVINSLLRRARILCAAQPNLSCRWESLEASLCHRDAKIWIHEGAWLSDNKPCVRNLIVDRWERNSYKITLAYRFEPCWAKLTPDSEIHLELKGGCVDQAFRSIDVSLKPSRSRELYEHGYT